MHYRLPTLVISLSFILLAATLALVTTLSAAPITPIYWQPASTNLPVNIEAFAATPLSATILYAGTWGQGIYRSTDHGETWQPANTGITLPLHIQGGLAVNPVTPTQVYAGDYYGGGLYRSDDGGISWTLTLSDTAVRAMAVHPLTPTIVLAGDREEGLYRSLDAGASWSPISATEGLTDPHVHALAFAPPMPDIAYAGAGSCVFVSANAGLTWTLASTLSSTVHALDIHPVTPSILYAGTFASGLFRSIDGGVTWTAMDNGIPEYAWVTSLAIHPVTPTTVYAGTWDGEVYRTVDDGVSWEGLGYLGTIYDVLVHPQAPSVIYAATSRNSVFRGSSLDHLTLDPIASPQYVNNTFPITLTARDALGFPLTGTTQTQLHTLQSQNSDLAATLASGGYAGTASLDDTTSTITPTQIAFVDGITTADVVITAPLAANVITATIPGGPRVSSAPFAVLEAPAASFGFDPIAAQTAGEAFTITIRALDAMGELAPYTGTVILEDTTGSLALTELGPCEGTLRLRCAGPFAGGVWSGQIVITQTYSNVVITASDGIANGSSNAFIVSSNSANQLRLLPNPMPDQTAYLPFTLTVLMQDAYGNLVTNYTGPLTLTDRTQAIHPSDVTCTEGRWDGVVNIPQARRNDVITVTTDDLFMTSTPFTVTPLLPEADFVGYPRYGRAPLNVQFTGTITSIIESLVWHFGDGHSLPENPNPTHTYQHAGEFDVSLLVTSFGGSTTVYKPDYIKVEPAPGAPTVTFSADVVSGTAPLTVTFTAVTSGTVEDWLWSFGDGTRAFTGPVVSHTYIYSGTFDVSVVVSNAYGSYMATRAKMITTTREDWYMLYLPAVLKEN